MGTTLENGIYLPDEGERNCYDGLAGNWVALDNHLGSTDIHVTINDKQAWNGHVADLVKHVTAADKQAWNGHVADLVKHVTAADKQAWNGKADASALTAHTGDTTIHVTAEDKAKWDAVTTKADDSAVMHLTGNESASGNKNFQGLLTTIPSSSLWPDVSNTSGDITYLGANAIHVEQKGSGKLTDLSGGAWSVAELGLGCFFFRINNGADIRYKHLGRSEVYRIPVVSGANRFINDATPDQDNTYDLGSSSLRWATINGLNPSSLGMPDLNNGVDISSYITVNGGNKESLYTPPANGWISVALTRTRGANMAVMLKQGNFASSGHRVELENGTATCNAMLPVKGGVQVSINSALADGIAFAYFYPCLGNV